ncbi:MAG: hypothetical protein Q7V57_13580 [Actinomycetota bacterium]|nr:hypothetical protein [Actinomycetota bacterium]
MNTKWSPAVERALREVGDTAPLAPSFDSLLSMQPTPAAPRGRRAGTFAAAALALAAAVALVVVVLPSDDDGSASIVGTSVAAPDDGEAARLAEICAMEGTGQEFPGRVLDSLRDSPGTVDGADVVHRFFQQCDPATLWQNQWQAVLDVAGLTVREQSRRELAVSVVDDTIELAFARVGGLPHELHATVFAFASYQTPIGYLSMDRPGTLGTFIPRSADGVQFADGVSTDEVDRYSTAGLAPGWYLVCATLTVPYGRDVCGSVHLREP